MAYYRPGRSCDLGAISKRGVYARYDGVGGGRRRRGISSRHVRALRSSQPRDRLRAIFLFVISCRLEPTDSNRTSASNDQLPLELARSILYLAMGWGFGTRLSSHRHRAKLKRQYPLAATWFLPPPS